VASATPGLPELPPSFARALGDLHRLAVYVVSPAQARVNGEIVLRASPGGFSTFEFDGHRVAVDGGELVVDGARTPITSLRAAAAAAGIEPDVGQQEAFDVPPHGDLDAPLAVDPAASRALGQWYAYVTSLLERLRAEAGPDDDPTPVRIWPEHFDAAIDMGDRAAGRRATYGGSPGDGHHAEPYLYASPWAGRVDGFFDDPGFRGAARTLSELRRLAADAGPDFLREARRRVLAAEPA
jgi:hypothetical protein